MVVLKVGTSSILTPDYSSIRLSMIATIAEVCARLKQFGFEPIVVSSGAVGVGCVRLHRKSRPTSISAVQALASVGQGYLMRMWDDALSAVNLRAGLILLTYDTFGERAHYNAASACFQEVLKIGAVPIVNNNDATGVTQIEDNDTLAAMVAAMVSSSRSRDSQPFASHAQNYNNADNESIIDGNSQRLRCCDCLSTASV